MIRIRPVVIGTIACALFAATPFFNIPGWSLSLATIVAFNAVALFGLNLIFGVAGMLAFGQAAFVALPAYACGMLVHHGWPLAAAIIVAAGGTLLVARLVAATFVRLPGVYFAVGTLGFAFVVEGLARAFPAETGGASGLVLASGRALPAGVWYAIALVTLAIAAFAYRCITTGPLLRELHVLRHDELAAATIGIDVARLKARVFTIGCAFSIVAGIALSFYIGVVVPESAGVDRSLESVGIVILGGLGLPLGPLIGEVITQWFFSLAGAAQRFELFVYGLAFLLAVLYAPRGIGGALRPFWQRIAGTAVSRRSPAPAAGAAPLELPHRGGGARGTALELRSIGKTYGGVEALAGVSFSVSAGEVFTVVGPNGAGKSTLFNIISGLETPTGGSVVLAGRDVSGQSIHERASAIGRSFQVPRLVAEATALENVMARLDRLERALPEAAKRAAALAHLAAFGLDKLADRPVGELSIGAHKLIDVTRAALGSPALILLDEPAVGLTPEELDHLAALIERLCAGGSAVVIVEHNIAFVGRVAARGIVLDGGRIIAAGTVDDMLATPAVHAAYLGVLA